MQIPCGVHSEMSAEGVVSGNPAGVGDSVPQFGGAVGVPSRGGTFDAGSCAHVVECAAEAFGIECAGIHQGKKCDSYCAGVCRTTKELCRPAFLGTWLLGVNGWQERGCRTSVYPEPRKRR